MSDLAHEFTCPQCGTVFYARNGPATCDTCLHGEQFCYDRLMQQSSESGKLLPELKRPQRTGDTDANG